MCFLATLSAAAAASAMVGSENLHGGWTGFDLPSGVDVLESSDLQPTAEMRFDYSDTTRALWAKS